jgi:hypothetical protein
MNPTALIIPTGSVMKASAATANGLTSEVIAAVTVGSVGGLAFLLVVIVAGITGWRYLTNKAFLKPRISNPAKVYVVDEGIEEKDLEALPNTTVSAAFKDIYPPRNYNANIVNALISKSTAQEWDWYEMDSDDDMKLNESPKKYTSLLPNF